MSLGHSGHLEASQAAPSTNKSPCHTGSPESGVELFLCWNRPQIESLVMISNDVSHSSTSLGLCLCPRHLPFFLSKLCSACEKRGQVPVPLSTTHVALSCVSMSTFTLPYRWVHIFLCTRATLGDRPSDTQFDKQWVLGAAR